MAKRRSDPEDDGRTIANMNVEGMPWYQEPSPDALPEDTLWVDIARGSGENDRIITITGGETR